MDFSPNGREIKTQAFGIKQKRFGSDETEVPGPGHYTAPDSCVVKEANRELGSYRSATLREINHIPKNIPGVGNFNSNEQYGLGTKQIQGGAPNNFTILSQSKNPFIHQVRVKENPRLPDTTSPSKSFISLPLTNISYSSSKSGTRCLRQIKARTRPAKRRSSIVANWRKQ